MRQKVKPLGEPWVSQGERWAGICDHGDHHWVIHRTTEYAAWRSLRAHGRECAA